MFATVDDVQLELGRQLTADEIASVVWWIGRAERMIRARVTDLDERLVAGTLLDATLTDVIVAAVARKVLNPDGVRTVMHSIDDASIQKTVDAPNPGGALYIYPHEWAALIPMSGAFSVRPHYAPGGC